ncbi:MAG TPA: 4Fe-4S dicluster domain-containing protein [Anaerolineae bacterium]
MSNQNQDRLTRREFLKQSGIGAAGLVTAGWPANGSQPAAPRTTGADDVQAILIDLTRCTGCNACTLACKVSNRLPHPDVLAKRLDSDAYTFVDQRQVEKAAGQTETCFVKRQCMHCQDPACVSACTVGALRKTAAGPVVYDAHKCIGCRYCQYACPFGVPAYEWENALGLIHKCQMCVERLEVARQPACVEACPNGALRFGKRAALLAQAHAQIISNPERYVDHVYGEHEAGGTSVLYLSAVPFAELGLPELGPEPIPHQAEAVMKLTPYVALTVASIATALHWILQRRELKVDTGENQ